MSITYVTGNYGKYISVKEYAEKENVDIEFFSYDLNEPDINDIETISKAKVQHAYSILQKPCFVADTGFYIDNYPNNPGYPGAFVKRSGISSNIEQLLETMQSVEDRKCRFIDCLTFYDGEDFYTFYGISEGTISSKISGQDKKKAKSALWQVFIPNNHTKTLAEMSDYELHNRNDGHTSATEAFINFYKNNYRKDHGKEYVKQ